jgi:hypothetical protein
MWPKMEDEGGMIKDETDDRARDRARASRVGKDWVEG